MLFFCSIASVSLYFGFGVPTTPIHLFDSYTTPLRDAASLLLLFARIVVCNNAFNGTAHTSTAPVHFPCDRKSGCKKSFLKIFTKNR